MLEEALVECVRLGGEQFGTQEVAYAGEVLRTLWQKVGAQTFGEWVRRTVVLVQQEKVLLCGMCKQDNGGDQGGATCNFQIIEPETCKGYDSVCPVCYLREGWLHGSSSQGQESDEQFARKLGTLVQKLSFQTAPLETFLRCMRCASEGTPAMREALASVEEEYQARMGHGIYRKHQERDESICFRKSVKPRSDSDAETWVDDRVSNTLNTFEYSDVRTSECVVMSQKIGGAAGFKGKASATAGGVGFSVGVTPTLIAGQEAHTVYALQGNGIDRADTAGCNGCGWRTDEMYTLNTIDRPAVVFPDTARSLCARYDSSPCADRGQNIVCVQNTGRGWWNESGVAETLRTPCGGDATKANLVVYDARGNGEGG